MSCRIRFYPEYVFKSEYRSDEPTFSNFDYDATTTVEPKQAAHSSPGWLIEPIVDNLNVISVETAEQTAKEFIA